MLKRVINGVRHTGREELPVAITSCNVVAPQEAHRHPQSCQCGYPDAAGQRRGCDSTEVVLNHFEGRWVYNRYQVAEKEKQVFGTTC